MFHYDINMISRGRTESRDMKRAGHLRPALAADLSESASVLVNRNLLILCVKQMM